MAQLLVKAQDSAVADSPGKWRQGDVVAVFDDDHTWGAAEGLPNFVIVIVPNIDAIDVTEFLEKHATELARRALRFDKSKLTAGQRNTLQTTGTITLTRVQIKAIKTAV